MMTRNDFELLAAALRSARSGIAANIDGNPAEALNAEFDGFSEAVNAVAEVCKANNSRFDKKRFMTACGMTA